MRSIGRHMLTVILARRFKDEILTVVQPEVSESLVLDLLAGKKSEG